MSSEKSASQEAYELLQEAYNKVEAKNYSAALQSCQAALAIYEKIGDQKGIVYTLSNITNICRLSIESVLSESEASLSLFEESPLSPDQYANRLRIRRGEGEPDPGVPPRPSGRMIASPEEMRRGEPDPPPPPSPSDWMFGSREEMRTGEPDIGLSSSRSSRLMIEFDEVMRRGEGDPGITPPPHRSRLVIELTIRQEGEP